ncbi:hypothetical protein BDR06DRAFT_1015707 [Suillus hirtellus]|nr:hypothetical protein BDR06DRAFT_1015707 [Suillus hirtellus]
MFSVDVECPFAALGDFLAWHPNIGQWHVIPDYHLQNLGILGDPPWYLLALLAKIHLAHSIQHLSVQFEEEI